MTGSMVSILPIEPRAPERAVMREPPRRLAEGPGIQAQLVFATADRALDESCPFEDIITGLRGARMTDDVHSNMKGHRVVSHDEWLAGTWIIVT